MGQILHERDGGIAFVTLSNPGKLNAIDKGMWLALADVFAALSAQDDLRCVIVRGADGNFAAGADIAEFPQVRATREQGMHYHTHIIAAALDAIACCIHPTVAAIEGVCVGGGLEIAAACDLRIAACNARFGIPINRLGFPLAPGEMAGLIQLIGKAATLEILLEGRVFDAAEAQDKGLVTRIADDVALAAKQSAARIANGSPLAARMNKRLARRLTAAAAPLNDDELREAFAFLDSEDYREGLAAFLARRDPDFAGR